MVVALPGSSLVGCVVLTLILTAIFLHLSYQRYYWFFLGLAAATIQVLSAAYAEPDEDDDEGDPEDKLNQPIVICPGLLSSGS